MRRRLTVVVAALALSVGAGTATAQTITGLVTDNTGGIMPGVTVEASSPALIEGSRVAFTDGAGRYTLIDLRPGTYTLTFSLPGFSTVVVEGQDLPADFTATVNAELSVGALEETLRGVTRADDVLVLLGAGDIGTAAAALARGGRPCGAS